MLRESRKQSNETQKAHYFGSTIPMQSNINSADEGKKEGSVKINHMWIMNTIGSLAEHLSLTIFHWSLYSFIYTVFTCCYSQFISLALSDFITRSNLSCYVELCVFKYQYPILTSFYFSLSQRLVVQTRPWAESPSSMGSHHSLLLVLQTLPIITSMTSRANQCNH